MILFVGFSVGEYSALRCAVYSGLPRMVGGFGLAFEADESATVTAPSSVRALVARDRKALRGEKVETPCLSSHRPWPASWDCVWRSLGGTTGQAAKRVLASKLEPSGGQAAPKSAGQAVVSGVKGVGSGFKRLFGRKKN